MFDEDEVPEEDRFAFIESGDVDVSKRDSVMADQFSLEEIIDLKEEEEDGAERPEAERDPGFDHADYLPEARRRGRPKTRINSEGSCGGKAGCKGKNNEGKSSVLNRSNNRHVRCRNS
jgi:hypothetical protein